MDPQPIDPIASEQAVKQAELIQLWAEVDRFLAPVSGTPASASLSFLNETQLAARARFASLFEEEIQVVTAARTAVAHARPIDDAVLDSTLELAREPVRIIHKGEDAISRVQAE